MAKLLLLETATEVCSVAIAIDGQIVALAEELDPPSHVARLTLLIRACVEQAGLPLDRLDAVAVSRGPGSYSSLRTGVSTAKGICYALGKPLLAVDTLRALAWASRAADHDQAPGTLLMPMIDARRREVWTAVYDLNLAEIIPAEPLIFENNLFDLFRERAAGKAGETRFILSGNGVLKIETGQFGEKTVKSDVRKCSAEYLTHLAEHYFQSAEFQDVAYFEPFYMKPPNITVSNKALF